MPVIFSLLPTKSTHTSPKGWGCGVENDNEQLCSSGSTELKSDLRAPSGPLHCTTYPAPNLSPPSAALSLWVTAYKRHPLQQATITRDLSPGLGTLQTGMREGGDTCEESLGPTFQQPLTTDGREVRGTAVYTQEVLLSFAKRFTNTISFGPHNPGK